jgi:hypothetical protein
MGQARARAEPWAMRDLRLLMATSPTRRPTTCLGCIAADIHVGCSCIWWWRRSPKGYGRWLLLPLILTAGPTAVSCQNGLAPPADGCW